MKIPEPRISTKDSYNICAELTTDLSARGVDHDARLALGQELYQKGYSSELQKLAAGNQPDIGLVHGPDTGNRDEQPRTVH